MAQLRNAIQSGELKPGQKLVSAVLEERWSVSQTPVREALQRLGSEGLVELSAQHGARVAAVSTRDMLEIYEVRMMLEPVAMTRSLRAADASYYEVVEDAFAALRMVLESEPHDMWGFERRHRAFHEALVASCDSQWILRIVRLLMEHSVRYRLLSWMPRGGHHDILLEHIGLYEAVKSGNVQRSSDLTYRHLRHTVDSVFDVIAPPEDDGRGATAASSDQG